MKQTLSHTPKDKIPGASSLTEIDKNVLGHSEDAHTYTLPHKGVDPKGATKLKFLHGKPVTHPVEGLTPGMGELLYTEGVTDEQLLQVLIKRTEYFQTVLPCEENEVVLKALNDALKAKLARTKKRQAAGVEGTMNPVLDKKKKPGDKEKDEAEGGDSKDGE